MLTKLKSASKRRGAANNNDKPKKPKRFKVRSKERDPIADSEDAYDQPVSAQLPLKKMLSRDRFLNFPWSCERR